MGLARGWHCHYHGVGMGMGAHGVGMGLTWCRTPHGAACRTGLLARGHMGLGLVTGLARGHMSYGVGMGRMGPHGDKPAGPQAPPAAGK
jgi:hypothetical protein